MSNSYFQFKQFTIHQDRCAMKVTTDACLFGAWVANDIKSNKDAKTLFDIGTGTGLLSLMIAQENSALEMNAIEIDKDAAEQAKENINASLWKEKIRVINDDVKNFKSERKFDLILTNPPFYENDLPSGDQQKDIAHHSKGLTLNTLLQLIIKNLTPKGNFYILLPYKRNNAIETLLQKNNLHIVKKAEIRQSVNHGYFRILIKGGFENRLEPNEEIAIRNNEQQYTDDFTRLLKDYYLYL